MNHSAICKQQMAEFWIYKKCVVKILLLTVHIVLSPPPSFDEIVHLLNVEARAKSGNLQIRMTNTIYVKFLININNKLVCHLTDVFFT